MKVVDKLSNIPKEKHWVILSQKRYQVYDTYGGYNSYDTLVYTVYDSEDKWKEDINNRIKWNNEPFKAIVVNPTELTVKTEITIK